MEEGGCRKVGGNGEKEMEGARESHVDDYDTFSMIFFHVRPEEHIPTDNFLFQNLGQLR
jgi:hypothetical protein